MITLAIPDRHSPWHHKKAMAWIVEVARQTRPDAIVGLGDEQDLYSLSRYPKSLNHLTPKQEWDRGRRAIEEHWRELKLAAPKAKLFEISSNHGDRLAKRTLESLPAVEHLLADCLAIPGVERIEGRLVLDGVVYEHGHRSKAVDHAKFNQQSTVHGHTHKASLTFLKNAKAPYFNMECGWLGDERKHCFSYKEATSAWTLACGLIRDGAPQLLVYPGRNRRPKERRAAYPPPKLLVGGAK